MSIRTSPRQSRRSSTKEPELREADSGNSQLSAGLASPSRLSLASNRSETLGGGETFSIEIPSDTPSTGLG